MESASYLLGIMLDVDATGMVKGARLAEAEMTKLQAKAQGLPAAVGKGMASAALTTLSMMPMMIQPFIQMLGGLDIKGKILDPAMKEAEVFQSAMTELKFVTGLDETVPAELAQLEELRNLAVDTGVKTAFGPIEAARALYELKSAGLTTEETIKSLNATLDLVALSSGKIELGSAAESIAVAMKKFGANTKGAKEIVDQFSIATMLSTFHVEEFGTFLNSLGDAPARFKMTTAEVFALGSALRNVGQLPAQAAQGIAGFVRRLAILERMNDRMKRRIASGYAPKGGGLGFGPAGEVVRMFQELGVDIFDKETGQFRGMTTLILEMSAAMDKLSTDQKKVISSQTVFGGQAAGILSAVSALTLETDKGILKGKDAFLEYIKRMEQGEGVAHKGAEQQLATWAGVQKLWTNMIKTYQLVLGATLIPLLSTVLKLATRIGKGILQFTKEHKGFATTLGYGVLVLALFSTAGIKLLSVLSTISFMLFGIGSALLALQASGVTFGAAMTMAFGAVKVAMMPFLLLAAKVLIIMGLLALAGYALYKAYETNFGGLKDMVDGFAESVSLVFQGISDFWNDWEADTDLVDKLRARGLLDIVIWILQLKARVEEFAKGFYDAFADTKNIEAPFFLLVDAVKTLIFTVAELFGLSTEWKAMGDDSYDAAYTIGAAIGFMVKFLIQGMTAVVALTAVVVQGINFVLDNLNVFGSVFVGLMGVIFAAGMGALVPIWLWIAAIGLLVYAGWELYDNWNMILEGIGLLLDLAWSKIESFAFGVANAWVTILTFIHSTILELFGKLIDLVTGSDVGTRMVDAIKEGVKKAWGGFTTFVGGLLDDLWGWIFEGERKPIKVSAEGVSTGEGMPGELAMSYAASIPTLEENPKFYSSVSAEPVPLAENARELYTPLEQTMEERAAQEKEYERIRESQTSMSIENVNINVPNASPAEARSAANAFVDELYSRMEDDEERMTSGG